MDTLPTKTILLVLNHLDAEDFLPLLEHCHFTQNLLVISDLESIRADITYPTRYLRVSFKNPHEIVAQLQELQHELPIVGIIGLDEEYRYTVSTTIADALNLPFYSQKLAATISDKYTQIQALAAHNVSVPAFEVIHATDTTTTVPFPNVLKIRSGIGSAFVYKNSTPSEFTAHLTDVRAHHAHGAAVQLIVEQFIGGDEYSCDYLVHGQTVEILRVVKKITHPTKFPFFKGFYLFNPDTQGHTDFILAQLQTLCSQTANALRITRGVCMMDFKCYNKQLYVIETTIRPGISQFIELMIPLYGYTSLDILIKQILGMDTEITISAATGLVFYITTEREGVLETFDTSCVQEKICTYYHVGDRVMREATKAYADIMLGHIIVEHVSMDKIEETIAAIEKKIVISSQ